MSASWTASDARSSRRRISGRFGGAGRRRWSPTTRTRRGHPWLREERGLAAWTSQTVATSRAAVETMRRDPAASFHLRRMQPLEASVLDVGTGGAGHIGRPLPIRASSSTADSTFPPRGRGRPAPQPHRRASSSPTSAVAGPRGVGRRRRGVVATPTAPTRTSSGHSARLGASSDRADGCWWRPDGALDDRPAIEEFSDFKGSTRRKIADAVPSPAQSRRSWSGPASHRRAARARPRPSKHQSRRLDLTAAAPRSPAP